MRGCATRPAGALTGPALPPLAVLYVYDRRPSTGKDWLEVGAAASGRRPRAGSPAGQAIDWRQTLTLAFTRTSNRDPALFFRDRRPARRPAGRRGPGAARSTACAPRSRTGRFPADFPVIAKEPDTYIDPNKQFYLLPILGFEQVYLESGHETMLLKVAAVTLQAGEQDLLAPTAPRTAAKAAARRARQPKPTERRPAGYRAGVVFVIDTHHHPWVPTSTAPAPRSAASMTSCSGSPLGDALSFGLVAFRDNVDVAPGLEYVSRVVATLDDGRDPASFFSQGGRVEEAKVSSKGFNEDAFAGVYDGLESHRLARLRRPFHRADHRRRGARRQGPAGPHRTWAPSGCACWPRRRTSPAAAARSPSPCCTC